MKVPNIHNGKQFKGLGAGQIAARIDSLSDLSEKRCREKHIQPV